MGETFEALSVQLITYIFTISSRCSDDTSMNKQRRTAIGSDRKICGERERGGGGGGGGD